MAVIMVMGPGRGLPCAVSPAHKEAARGGSASRPYWPPTVMRRGDRGIGWKSHYPTKEESVVLATAKIEDFDRFWNTFSTKGAEKRKQHGSKGAHVFQDPNERTGSG